MIDSLFSRIQESGSQMNSQKARKTLVKARQEAQLPKMFVDFIRGFIVSCGGGGGHRLDNFQSRVPGLAKSAFNRI